MRCHQVDDPIFGNAMQIVKVELDPVDMVIAEAGKINYFDDSIAVETKLGGGSVALAIHCLIANSASLFSCQQKSPP
ncbi:MAG: hypothetical protein RPR28_00765 [Cycloclasticus sp.]